MQVVNEKLIINELEPYPNVAINVKPQVPQVGRRWG